MATKKNEKQEALQQEKLKETVSKTEQFYNENKKTIWGCIIAAAVIALGVLAYNQFYLKPKKAEAQEQMYPAEAAFRQGNFDLALNGDGNNLGFLDIISSYGSTKTGKLASYYAGICYMKQGNYNDAIEYLKKYNNNDQILSAMALGAIGDCYMELGNNAEAANYYGKAARKNPNNFTSPMFLTKEGMTYEIMGNYAKALEAYKMLKKDFPLSNEAFEISKNIAYLEEKMK